ncbi:MAG: DUF2797 domain-containing protein [Schleiferiaceae bacterium]|nr:DUF2797 domain-containing protein [Schleiferiaceae bacterium]
MQTEGPLSKLLLAYQDPIQVYAEAGAHILHLNAQIGKMLRMESLGLWNCMACGEIFSSLFRMGCCKRCFFESPMAGDSILRPELSTAHLGQADRDLDYEARFQLQAHIVYLADSGGIKVGVTREAQRHTRWMDQGASRVRIIARTENRYEAGVIEVALKAGYSDKTSWRHMLGGMMTGINLKEEALRAFVLFPPEMKGFFVPDGEEIQLLYPAQGMPKVTSIKLADGNGFEGRLVGIRGQYLLLEGGRVFNVRAHEGAQVRWKLEG